MILLSSSAPACSRCMSISPLRTHHNSHRNHKWVIDSGASVHCVSDPSLLTSVYYKHPPVLIKVADNRTLQAHAVGTAVLPLLDQHRKTHNLTLHNVIYHPNFHTNLLSVRRLWLDNHIMCRFDPHNYLQDSSSGTKFPIAYDRQYISLHINHVSSIRAVDDDLIHARFAHASARRLDKLATRSIGFPKSPHDSISLEPTSCDACNAGAARRRPFQSHSNPTKYPYFGARLSSDLCGPFPKSIDSYVYMLNIVDAHTNYLQVYFLRTKSSNEVKACLESFLHEFRSQLPRDPTKLITWHTDNGGEFMSTDLHTFCDEFAISRSFSTPYAPPQNAHAERMWGLVLRSMRVMLAASHVHESFWTYAARHACMLHNMLPSSRLAGEISPYQALHHMPPDVSKVRVWGCSCWYYLPDHERDSKISPRALPAVHLGLDPRRNGYVVYVPHLNRITTAYHLTFQERKFLHFTPHGIVNIPRKIRPLRDVEQTYREPRDTDQSHVPLPTDQPLTTDDLPMCDHPHCTLPQHSDDIPHSYETRPTRDLGPNPPRYPNRPPPNYIELAMYLDDVSDDLLAVAHDDTLSDILTPSSYQDAISSRHASRWRESMNIEIEDLLKHDTWDLVPRNEVPKTHKVAKSRWVYKVKVNKDGSIERFKSRFVVCGYSQVKGVDYTHSFSATMRATSFRLLMALATHDKLKLEHFDVTSAFTQSEIDKVIFVEPPEGYPQRTPDGTPCVLKLRKALYGTKQASRMWQLKLRKHLVDKMGFTNSTHDPCLFSRRVDDSILVVGVYVDDIIVSHNGPKHLEWFKSEFTGPNGFRAKHVGSLSWFLGVEVIQHEDFTVTLSQTQYIKKLLERFVPARPASLIKHAMPCNPLTFQSLACATSDVDRDKASRLPYMQLIGSLLYLSTMTRPDIAYHMSVLCSLMHDPTPLAYYAAIDLLLYVSASSLTLHFPGVAKAPSGIDSTLGPSISSSGGLVAFSDSTWRRPDHHGYNMFGFVVYFMGAPVSFTSKQLKIVALSSAEAEYAAASYACREVVFVRNVLVDLGFPITYPTVLCVDNKAAIEIAHNIGVTSRNKHFVDAIHYFRHLVDHRVVVPSHVLTRHQRADGFTKCLGKSPFKEWLRLLLPPACLHNVV